MFVSGKPSTVAFCKLLCTFLLSSWSWLLLLEMGYWTRWYSCLSHSGNCLVLKDRKVVFYATDFTFFIAGQLLHGSSVLQSCELQHLRLWGENSLLECKSLHIFCLQWGFFLPYLFCSSDTTSYISTRMQPRNCRSVHSSIGRSDGEKRKEGLIPALG